ncbi:MAG: hypothetical protein OEZ22_10905 [Spirochaetia bacterium]|nr:hypothetical protein [Spirochaetia bacterium]
MDLREILQKSDGIFDFLVIGFFALTLLYKLFEGFLSTVRKKNQEEFPDYQQDAPRFPAGENTDRKEELGEEEFDEYSEEDEYIDEEDKEDEEIFDHEEKKEYIPPVIKAPEYRVPYKETAFENKTFLKDGIYFEENFQKYERNKLLIKRSINKNLDKIEEENLNKKTDVFGRIERKYNTAQRAVIYSILLERYKDPPF